MKNLIILLTSLFLFTSCQSTQTREESSENETFKKMAIELAEGEKFLKRKTVAVYGFEIIGRSDDNYSKYATEKLTHALVKTGKLMVVERSSIDKVLQEQAFSVSGSVDAASAAKIGKLLSVDAVIIGKIRVTDKKVEFISRIIQSERGVILASSNQSFTPSEQISSGKTGKKGIGNGQKNSVSGDLKLSTNKSVYGYGERIVVEYSGMPGYRHDWITIVRKNSPDASYRQYFYTYGSRNGTLNFKGLTPGKYEVRAYYNWPKGSYVVRGRLAITVE